jgi:hypothetical protein
MSASPWFSKAVFNQYSALSSFAEGSRTASGHERKQRRTLDSAALQQSGGHLLQSKDSSGTDVPPSQASRERLARPRERHSSARIGSDKLQVRASADAPYDLDVVAAVEAQTERSAWFAPFGGTSVRDSGSGEQFGAVTSPYDPFEAKLDKFRSRAGE